MLETFGRCRGTLFSQSATSALSGLFQKVSLIQNAMPEDLVHDEEFERSRRQDMWEGAPVVIDKFLSELILDANRPEHDQARLVVLAPPGGGKSTLMQFFACSIARFGSADIDSKLIPAPIVLQDWERWCAGPESQRRHRGNEGPSSIPEYLAQRFATLENAPSGCAPACNSSQTDRDHC
jgi:hypothetical protein